MSAKTAHQIDAEAADWAARLDRGPLSAGQEQAFQAWLDGDVRCLGAYAPHAGRGACRPNGPGRWVRISIPPTFVAAPSVLPRRRVLQMGGAIAATLLVGVGGLAVAAQSRPLSPPARAKPRSWR